jgi:uncharacterized protein (TIGR03067 family)
MNRTILFTVLMSLITTLSWAQEQPTESDGTQTVSPTKAIVLIIDPAAEQSEVVKQVVEALEKAGIAQAETSDKAVPSNSKISVTLSIRPDVSFEKIKHLIEALQRAGASQLAFRAMETPAVWKETHNFIRLTAQPDYSTEELLRIEQAIEASAIERGLEYLIEKQIPGQKPALTHHAATTPKQAPAATDPPARESETRVLTVKGCAATDVAQLLKHLQPDPAFQAFGNNGAFRLVISGTPEQLKSAEATVSRMQELLTQIRQGENRLFELLKSLGTEHPNVLKLNAELEALDTEIVKLESGFKHYNPPKRIEEFKSPPKLDSIVSESDPPVDQNKLVKLGIVLHRITPQKAAQLLKLVIDDDTFTAVPEENSNILRVTGTKLHFEILESVLKQVEQPAKAALPQRDQEETLFQSAEALERQRDPASADSGKTEGIDPPVDANDANEPPDPDYEKIVILRIDGGPETYAIIPPLQAALGKLRIAVAPVDFAQNTPDRKDDFHVTLVMRSEESPENIAPLIDWMTKRDVYDFTFGTKENPSNVVLIDVWNETVAVQQLIESLQNPVDSPVKFDLVRRDQPKGTACVKVLALKYAQATEVAEVLKQVYDKGPSKIVPDARTNSVIVTGPEGQVQEIEALLKKLDETGNSPASPARRMRTYRVKVGDTLSGIANRELGTPQYHAIIEANRHLLKSPDSLQPGMELMIPTPLGSLESEAAKLSPRNGDAPGAISGEVQQQIAQLRKEYEAADSEARLLARQLQTTPDGAQKNEAQKADLRRAVQRAFTSRQSLLRAELMEMQSRLLQTQRSIEMRERISDQIIQRRVEDLLNPDIKWDEESPSAPPSPSIAPPQSTTRQVTTELEGKWHGLSMTNLEGIPLSAPLCNVTVQGDQWTSGPSLSSQLVSIDAERKTVRFSDARPSLYQYELSGDRLTMRSESIIMTLARGHDPALDRIIASRSIPKGMRVFTFSANDTHTHAGLLRPGDKVDVTVTFADRKGNLVTKVLLECIEVFATENKTVHSEDAQNEQRPRSVSLLVTPEQDGFVKIAQSKGQLALSLRHPDDAEVKNLNGINSAIMEEMRRSIGEDELPRPSGDDETRWRSAVVEILVSGKSDVADNGARKVGFGIIVAADGTMLSHMGGGWSSIIRDWPNIDAQFDDGSIVPLQIVDEGGSGFVVLRPKQSVNLNHHFPLSGTTTTVGDEVYVGGLVLTSSEKKLYGMSATAVTLSQTERRVATLAGLPVWQLTSPEQIPNSLCYPVLNKDGELLAITLADTGGLLLAMPVEKLREILPQSLGMLPTVPAKQTAAPQPAKGAEAPADPKAAMLAKLHGVWDVEFQSEDGPKEKPEFRVIAAIRDHVMTWSLDPPQPDNDKPPVFLIKLGEPSMPQPLDLVMNPNDGDQRAEMRGILEMSDDMVRICCANSAQSKRPEVFAVGKDADVWELRRRPAVSTTSELEGDWHSDKQRQENQPPNTPTVPGDQ